MFSLIMTLSWKKCCLIKGKSEYWIICLKEAKWSKINLLKYISLKYGFDRTFIDKSFATMTKDSSWFINLMRGFIQCTDIIVWKLEPDDFEFSNYSHSNGVREVSKNSWAFQMHNFFPHVHMKL